MCQEYANVYTSILECRSNPSSHSRVGDRLVRFRVTDQEALVAVQGMRFRDVMFDVGYRAKRESGANDQISIGTRCLPG